MDRTELAWAAGFWDGEGSTYLTGAAQRMTRQPQARINQSSLSGIPEVLVRFQAGVGLGRISGPELEEGREPIYRWVVSSRAEVHATYAALCPWLGQLKRQQFASVLGLDLASDDIEDLTDRQEKLAWCAGLFDGEGSTCLLKHGSHEGYFVLEANITQSSWVGIPEVLQRFRDTVETGWVYGPYDSGEGQAPVYRWRAYRREDIGAVIKAMRPWLGSVKRDQADEAFRLVDMQVPLPRGNPAWGSHKTHCIRGHDYETVRLRPFKSRGKNTEAPRASHQCLACVRDAAREKRRTRRSDG